VDIILEHCAGLDVHRSTVVACVLGVGGPSQGAKSKRAERPIQTFATTPDGLAQLVKWLQQSGVTHAGMEATGVYWMPVFAALEAVEGITPLVVNARHVKNVPGRKTDVKDAEWLAQLIRHGLVTNGFVPAKPFRELRELVRYRRSLVEAQASERQRLIKLLEGAGVKLAGVLTDVFGVSGRAMILAMIEGEATPEEMAKLAKGVARAKYRELAAALAAPLAPHQRKILACQFNRVKAAEADIAALVVEIDERLKHYAKLMTALMKIPGLDRVAAMAVLAEIGDDLSKFPSVAALSAWAGVCPGSRESAGKSKPTGARKGNPYLRTILCNAAVGATKKKNSYYKGKYHKLKARRGAGRAILAIAHKLLIAIYHVLKGEPFRDLGETYLDQRNLQRAASRHVKQLQALGYTVKLEGTPNFQPKPATSKAPKKAPRKKA